MAFILSENRHEKIYIEMFEFFSDMPFFAEASVYLEPAIFAWNHDDLRITNIDVKLFVDENYDMSLYVSKQDQKRRRGILKVFQALSVLVASKKFEATSRYFTTVQQLHNHFPGLSIAWNDVLLLLKFRNMVVACLCVMDVHRNKGTILFFAGRLSGTKDIYVTGSGQKPEVRNREFIFETEGKYTKENRSVRYEIAPGSPKRRRNNSTKDESANKKRDKCVRPENLDLIEFDPYPFDTLSEASILNEYA